MKGSPLSWCRVFWEGMQGKEGPFVGHSIRCWEVISDHFQEFGAKYCRISIKLTKSKKKGTGKSSKIGRPIKTSEMPPLPPIPQ
jgi:hypothetical protein